MNARSDREEVADYFRFHPPKDDSTVVLHTEIREMVSDVADWVMEHVPNSAERCNAVKALREAMMWSNAAIAIHQ